MVREAFLEEVGGGFREAGALLGCQALVDAMANTTVPLLSHVQVQVMDPLRPPRPSRHQNSASLGP